jgi:DNA excision repair protein ERCC-2
VTASAPVISVQVRELVEFALRRGNLGSERDFVGPQRALAGTRGHQQVQRSRPSAYQKEVRVAYDLPTPTFTLRVQGRIDGVLVAGERTFLEEIKTVDGVWDGVAGPLHWAQLKIYGFIYAHDNGLDHLELQLVYLSLASGALTEFHQSLPSSELDTFFHETTAIYSEWLKEHLDRCRERDASIQTLEFPFGQYRPGQRDLAISVYRAITREERLFLEAPTGIGKTMSVLFPSVKAMAEGKLERIFYLTARTTARAVAESAFDELGRAGLRLRTLTLTAKEKICSRQGQACDPQLCPLAIGYYDRLKPAMRAALAQEALTRPVLESVAQEYQVCPFELGLDLSLWMDAVICDYNYAFDPSVFLRRHFAAENGSHVLLIDEAHNLVDRAREMFSAQLSTDQIDEVKHAIRSALPACAKALAKLNKALRNLVHAAFPEPAGESPTSAHGAPTENGELDLFTAPSPSSTARSDLRFEGEHSSRELPADVLALVDRALREMETWLTRNQPAEFRPALLELYFALFSFARAADWFDERYRTLCRKRGRTGSVQLICLDPSAHLQQALQCAKAAVFFSATLSPLPYYRELLGGRPTDPLLQLPSPFPPEHLAVLIHDALRTRFKDRNSTLKDVAEAIGELTAERSGNYLVYLPSYQYLAALQEMFQQLFPAISVLVQKPGMTEEDRAQFLHAFGAHGARTQVGFAVMGGVFGEGIDLVGDRLIGAVIVGVGLPQLCLERDLMRDYFQDKLGYGFDYAYTFPGMNRVLQAVGRVIRSETDRGVVLLVDTRFGEMRYRRLFPSWWQPRRLRTRDQIRQTLQQFWSGM